MPAHLAKNGSDSDRENYDSPLTLELSAIPLYSYNLTPFLALPTDCGYIVPDAEPCSSSPVVNTK